MRTTVLLGLGAAILGGGVASSHEPAGTPAPRASAARPSLPLAPAAAQGAEHEHGIETENLFGFTFGSDSDEEGARVLAGEAVLRTGRRTGTYRAMGQKLEFGFGVTDDFSLAFGLLGDYHRVRGVPDFEDVRGRTAFNGFGAEIRYRFLNRATSPFGLTLQLEPSIARIDEVTGLSGRKLGSENRLILDRELVPDTLFGAVNLIYDVEKVKERAAAATERASTAGIGVALSYQVAPKVFLGAEARYLRGYEGLALRRYEGDAVYLGPTLFAHVLPNAWLSAAWNVQVAGREAVDRRGRAVALAEATEAGEAADLPARRGRLNLAGFERHLFRVKIGIEF